MKLFDCVKSVIGWLAAISLCIIYSFLIAVYLWTFGSLNLASILFLALVLVIFVLLSHCIRNRVAIWVLAIVYLCLFAGFVVYIESIRNSIISHTVFFQLSLYAVGNCFLVLSLGACFLFRRFLKRKGIDPAGYWRAIVILLLALPLVYLAVDAPSLENDYTLYDLRVDLTDAKESGETLLKLNDVDWKKIRPDLPVYMTIGMTTNALAHAAQIESAWMGSASARKIIEQLDTFSGIADPVGLTEDRSGRRIWRGSNLLALYGAYQWYIALRMEAGQSIDDALSPVITLHSVAQKALPYAISGMSRSWWVASLRFDIDAAFHVVSTAHCTADMLNRLHEVFVPISASDLSCWRICLFDYLECRRLLDEEIWNQDKILESTIVVFINNKSAWKLGVFGRSVSWLVSPFIFNRNRARRELKSDCDFLLRWTRQSRPDLADLNVFVNQRRSRTPRLKNLLWEQSEQYLWFPNYSREVEQASEMKVRSDLFAMYLAKRLGKEVKLQDYYTGREYLWNNKTGVPFSAGPDGKAGTTDDIRLGEPQHCW